MPLDIASRPNSNDESAGGDFVLNDTTYVEIKSEGSEFIQLIVENDNDEQVLLKMGTRERLLPGRAIYDMDTGNKFIGPIEAKSVTGAPTIKVSVHI